MLIMMVEKWWWNETKWWSKIGEWKWQNGDGTHEMTWINDDERKMMMMDYGMMDAKQMIIMNKIIEKLFKWNDDRSEGKNVRWSAKWR
jgi:hypothetical protein